MDDVSLCSALDPLDSEVNEFLDPSLAQHLPSFIHLDFLELPLG